VKYHTRTLNLKLNGLVDNGGVGWGRNMKGICKHTISSRYEFSRSTGQRKIRRMNLGIYLHRRF
jgi:hypothetical protein